MKEEPRRLVTSEVFSLLMNLALCNFRPKPGGGLANDESIHCLESCLNK